MNRMTYDAFREAVTLCEQRDFDGIPADRHVFSPDFEEKMRSLAANISRRAARRRTARVIVAAALIGLLALLSVLGAGALREAGYFFKGVTHTAEIAANESDELTDTRLPTYIPAGYEPFYTITDFNMVQKVWARGDGKQIIFIQQRDQNIMYDYLGSGGPVPELIDTVIDGDTVYYVSDYQGQTVINWYIGADPDPRSHFLLICGTDPDEAVRVALSVRLAEKKYNSMVFIAEEDGVQLPGHDRIEGLYRLSRLPEGFVFHSELGCDIHSYHTNYSSDSGEMINLRQLPIRYTSMEFDSQHHNVYTVTRGGIDYNCIVSDRYGWSDAYVVWVRYGYIFQINTTSLADSRTFDEQTVIDAAESLRYIGSYDWSDDLYIPQPPSPSDVSGTDAG